MLCSTGISVIQKECWLGYAASCCGRCKFSFQNTADMRTRGWELAVNWRDRIGKFNYRVGFNLSDSYSEITKYDDNAASKLLSNFIRDRDWEKSGDMKWTDSIR